ncbi:MAG: cupin domain-containing protein [Gammaproteobacteria bacterium]|nr:cupin domain-containing protein [Gammaproteobacteria bacterium]
MKIANIKTTPSRTIRSSKTGEKFSDAQSLNEQLGITSLLVHQETLLPGRRGSSSHYHTHKDEIFYVIEGSPTLVVDGEKTVLSKGDYAGFSALQKKSHMLINESENKAVILTIGTNPDTDQVHYSSE